jgi:hypothetical protein
MYKKINTIIIYLTFAVLIFSAYLSFTSTWIAKDINFWQHSTLKANGFYPIVTMFCLFIPPMLLLLPLKFYIKIKLKKEKLTNEKR